MTNNDKKYFIPIEMDKEYAEKAGIKPEEIKKIVLYGKLTDVYFAEVPDKETYLELMRPIWQADKEYKRGKRCMVSNGKGKLIKCTGDCSTCIHKPGGGNLSYDEMEDRYGYGAVTDSGVHKNVNTAMYSSSPEDIISDAMMFERLWECISELTEENQTILKMFGNGASDSEIAAVVGMSKSGLNYRKNQLLKNLKNIF